MNFKLHFAALRGLLLGIVASLVVACQNNPDGSNGNYPPPFIPEAQEGGQNLGPRPDDGRIRVGDTLELFVSEDPGFDGPYKVREAGDIIIPKVGRISVANQSVSSAKRAIESALEESQLQEASVIVDRISRAPEDRTSNPIGVDGRPKQQQIRVFITGKVNRPGQHMLPLPEGRPLGVYEAILISGGISKFGDEQKVNVIRTGKDGKKYRIPASLREIEDGLKDDLPIGQGDIVVVPEKVFGF